MSLGFDTDDLYEGRLLRESFPRRSKKLIKGKKALAFLAKKLAAALKKRPGTAGTSSDPQGVGQSFRTVVPISFTAREDSAVLGTLDRHEQIERNIDIEDPDTMPASLKRPMSFTESRRVRITVRRFLEQRRLKGEKNVQGMNIKIEKRKWDQPPRKLRPYGYIDKTKGVDGDNLDVFLGPNLQSDHVFVIHSLKPSTGKFDEDKVMLGFNNGKAAKACFLDHYKKPKMYGGMDYFTIDRFKTVAAKTEDQPRRLVASAGFSMKSLSHPVEPNVGGQAHIFTSRRRFKAGGPGSGPHKGDASDIVSSHAEKVPKKVWIEKAGAIYKGSQEHPDGGFLHYFNDPKTDSTLGMKDTDIRSEHDVLDHMRQSRKKFGVKESRTREGRVYYARPMSMYESKGEDDDLDFLESKFDGEDIVAPRTCESGGDKDMSTYHKMVDESDAVVIRPYRLRAGKHRVTAGVFSEAQHALHKGIPVRMIHNGKLHEVQGFHVRKPARADGDFADVILKKRNK